MFRILTCMTAILLVGVGPARACNVPVFRYSLERWQPDRYEMVVIHREPLTAAEVELVDSLCRQSDKCNLAAEAARIDVTKIDAADRDKLIERYGITQFPWVVVRYPDHVTADGPAYSGPLKAEALRQLLDSPARTELADRLLQGQSAVWLLLESGNAKHDDEVEAKLKGWLSGLEKTLKLPELTPSPKDKLLREDLPLKVSFSVLRVSRSAAAEKHFVHILRHMEKDLSRMSEPMAIPVFGRGLALYAIVGKGITSNNVEEAARFLTGACSCEVKRLNPGVDLLMTADWDGSYTPAGTVTPETPITLVREEIPQPRDKKALPVTAPLPPPATVPGPPIAAWSANDAPLPPHSPTPPTTTPETSEAPSNSCPVFGNLGLIGGIVMLFGAIAIGLYFTMRFVSNKSWGS